MAEERKKDSKEELRGRVEELSALYELGRAISSTLNLERVLSLIVEKARYLMNAQVCSLRLLDEQKGDLVLKAAHGHSRGYWRKKRRIRPGESVTGLAAILGKPVTAVDVQKNKRYKYPSLAKKEGLRSLLAVPLLDKGKTIGTLNVYTKEKHRFSRTEIKRLSMFASQAVIAIDNARLHERLRNVYLGTVTALASAIDAKDRYTYGHSREVAKYALAIAKEMKLPKAEMEVLGYACQLHDIGKISIPDYILGKSIELTNQEWKEIKAHAARGADILKPIDFLDGVTSLVRQHHERYDGTGYPKGLKGKDILLGARIIAVADAYQAMISERPYRPAYNRQEAIRELKRCAGSQFDPNVVKAFLKVLRRRKMRKRGK